MTIVSLEDDEPFWDLLKDALEEEFPEAKLQWIRTESQFYEQISAFAATPPTLFLLDVMVKWADAAEKMPAAPKDVVEESYYRAGLRCRKRLLENPITAKIPVILYTVLERSDIDRVTRELADTTMVGKSGDFRELISAVNNLLGKSQISSTRRS